MKKILIVVPSLGIGGQERIAVNMVTCLKDVFDVSMVMFQSKVNEYAVDCNIKNINVPTSDSIIMKIFGQIKRVLKLRKIIKTDKPDVVFSLGSTANLTNVLSKSKFVKIIVAIHGFAEVKKNKLNDIIFKRADRVVAISKEMQLRLLKIYPKLDNTVVIENGYDLKEINKETRKVYSYETPKFVAMGRLEIVKGFDRLIKAFSMITKQIPKATLSIIGDGSQRKFLEDLASELNIADKVVFKGYIPEPLLELLKNDIYLLTSRNEGFPNCLIEALNCGLAIVSVDCLSGPKEILSEKYSSESIMGIVFEKYGVLVENFQDESMLIEQFAVAVTRLVFMADKIEEYKKIGFLRAQDFSLAVFKQKLCNLIEK